MNDDSEKQEFGEDDFPQDGFDDSAPTESYAEEDGQNFSADEEISSDEFSESEGFEEEEFSEEGDFAEEDWDEYDDSFDDSGDEGGKKKSSNFNKILILGAVIVGCGIIYMQMGKGDTNTTAGTAPDGTQVVQQQIENTVVSRRDKIYGQNYQGQATVSTTEAVEGGILHDRSKIGDAERSRLAADPNKVDYFQDDELSDDDKLPMPSAMGQASGNDGDVKSAGALTPMLDLGLGDDGEKLGDAEDMRSPKPRPPEDTAMKLTDTEWSMTDDKPDTGGMLTMPRADDVMIKTTMTDGHMGEDHTNAAAAALKDKIHVRSQNGNHMGTEMAGDMSSDDMKALAGRLDMLFDRLDNIEDQLDTMKMSETRLTDIENSIKSLKKSGVSTRSTKTTRSSSSMSKPKKTVSSAPKKTSHVSNSGKKWVLKAAQPGKAMLARQGEREVFSVSVGESISGLGRIKAVEMRNGRWVVVGTSGQVNQ